SYTFYLLLFFIHHFFISLLPVVTLKLNKPITILLELILFIRLFVPPKTKPVPKSTPASLNVLLTPINLPFSKLEKGVQSTDAPTIEDPTKFNPVPARTTSAISIWLIPLIPSDTMFTAICVPASIPTLVNIAPVLNPPLRLKAPLLINKGEP